MFNPYTHQGYLFVPNAEVAALGQFMSDHAGDLEGFYFGVNPDLVGVSTDGIGPPDGWTFASWLTEGQADAFVALSASFPTGTEIQTHVIGTGPSFDDWLSTLTPPMQRIVEEL